MQQGLLPKMVNFAAVKVMMKPQPPVLIRQNLPETVARLREKSLKIALTVHVNPDGDALGAALALYRLLSRMGHTCLVIAPNEFPDFLKWMPGAAEISILSSDAETAASFVVAADMLFVVDFNEPRRIEKLAAAYEASGAFKVLIDHHPAPEIDTDAALSDTSVSSSAELMYRFMEEGNLLGYADTETATCLFTGIMTDTGCFSHNSSDPRTYQTVAALLGMGINKDDIYHQVYDNFSASRMQLLGFSLHEKMVVLPEYHTAFISLSREEQERFQFRTGDSEGFVNYPLSIRGIRFTALFMEKDGYVKVSLRSRGNFAVNHISKQYFNGGGHRNASGGESRASLSETVSRFTSLLESYRDQLTADED